MESTTRAPIIVGLDGSAGADAALTWAAEAAHRRGVRLRLVHATELTASAGRTADRALPVETVGDMSWSVLTMALVDLEDADLAVETHLGSGYPTTVLLQQAQGAQMVVLGSRGHGAFVSLLLGSTSLQVAMHAPCPVVVVRPGAAPDASEARSVGQIVVGVDGSELSDAAVRFAFEEADSRGVGLTGVHAWLTPPVDLDATGAEPWQAAEQEERALLSARLARWSDKYPDVAVRQHVVRADPVSALVAESAGALLTVVGSRGAGGFTGLLLGSVSHAVLHHAGSPVAVVRTTR